MKDNKYVDDVRTRLVLSGIGELCEHGIKEFSLRRVAIAAQVSCAAPYRHFESKADLILEIIKYINSRHDMLCLEVERSFAEDTKRAIVELAVASVRFWSANGSFRTVLMLDNEEGWEDRRRELDRFDSHILGALDAYSLEHLLPESERERLKFLLLSLIYGTVTLVGTGKHDGDAAVLDIKRELERVLVHSPIEA